MIRTQILLEPRQQKVLAQRARQQGKSVSQMVREWIDEKLGAGSSAKNDPLLKLSGLVRDKRDARDVSERHDEYLYGKDAGLHWRRP